MLRQIPLRAAIAAPSRLVLAQPAARPIISSRFLATASTPSSTSTTPSSSTPAAAAAAASQTTPAPKAKRLTYLVERTASKNVPVYDDKRAGGTRRLTLIKKVVGNSQDLKNDIISELRFNKDDVSVNPVTGHVVIKGHFQHKVAQWLEARGF